MKKRRKRKGISIIFIAFWCIWLCVLTFAILNNVTQSRYVGKAKNSKSEVQVAKPIITLSKTTLSSGNNHPLRKEIAFTIQNYNGQEVSEIAMTYYLNITKKTGLPLTYTLYRVNGGTRQVVPLTNNLTANDTFPHTISTQHSYILELAFTSPPSNQDIQEAVSIALHAEQIQ